MSRIKSVVVFCAVALAFGAAAASAQTLLQQGQDLLKSLDQGGSSRDALTTGEIGRGLKSALNVATRTVVKQLAAADGFNGDPAVHIPLPDSLKSVQSTMRRFGMADLLDDLELKLNRAAERATPKARRLFLDAVAAMTLEDVRGILGGPDDAATMYFQGKMSRPLAAEMRPIVDDTLAEVGAIAAYDKAIGEYRNLPLVPDVKADLTEHVVELGLEGIFHYVAREEAAIRKNPIKRTNAILKRVFGAAS